MQKIVSGTSYGIQPQPQPRTINVRIPAGDFINFKSPRQDSLLKANFMANPDAWNYLISAGGGSASIQQGYAGGLCPLDISTEMASVNMSWIASVYIDNSAGAGVCVLRHQSTGLQVTAAPFTQGHYPMLLPPGSDFSFQCAYIDSDPYINLTGSSYDWTPSFGAYPDTTKITSAQGAGGPFRSQQVESGFLRLQFTDLVVPPSQWSTRNTSNGVWYDHSIAVPQNVWTNVAIGNPFRKGLLVHNFTADPNAILYINPIPTGGPPAVVSAGNAIAVRPQETYREMGAPIHVGPVFALNVLASTVVCVIKELM